MLKNIHNGDYKNLKNEYVIEFNANSLPIDWNKWIQLDKKIINLNISHNKYFCLDNFSFVVIESFDEDFELKINVSIYEFEKGRKYIPIPSFSFIHIKIKKGLKIFFSPGYSYNINSNCWKKNYDKTTYDKKNINGYIKGDSLWYFMNFFRVILQNLNLINNQLIIDDANLIMISGHYVYCNELKLKNTKSVSIDDFYSDYLNKANGLVDIVYFIDEFVQSDIIKILQVKR